MNIKYTQLPFLIFFILFLTSKTNAQVLANSPCAEPVGSQWTVGAACVNTTTAGFTSLFNPGSCNSGAFDDGWAWYTGTGVSNTITFTPAAGQDAIIHLFEVPDPAVCSVIEIGCSDNGGAGVPETIVGGGITGRLYYIRIQLFGSNNTLTGCLGVAANPPTCTDGIQNGTETGVDCGGSCPAPCPPPASNSTTGCPTTINSTMSPLNCTMIGTPFFDAATGIVNFNGSSGPTSTPSPAPGAPCGGVNGGTEGCWALYDPANGVGAASLDVNVATATGSADVFMAFYQGNACGSLTYLGCQLLLDRVGSNFFLQPVNISGINPAQNLYVFTYSSQPFTFSADLQGFPSVPSNDNCATAEVVSQNGCNLGATPSTFTPPSNFNAAICAGGTWYSNENTVYYSFTPTATSADLQITNIACNNGQGGLAQFGVWTSCAAINLAPTAANGFLGCVVGTSPLSLTGLTIGQTYFIAVDGNAGDLCSWNFSTTGGIILLQQNLLSFTAQAVDKNVQIDWATQKAWDVGTFTIQRSVDGIAFEPIQTTNIVKNTAAVTTYSTQDLAPLPNTSYYRLQMTNPSDGSVTFSQVVAVSRESLDLHNKLYIHKTYPQPFSNNLTIDLETGTASKVSIKLLNNLGQVVYQKRHSVTPSQHNKLTLDLGHLGVGIYSLVVEDDKTKISRIERIIKQ